MTDDDDPFDENGILKDGRRWRVPTRMLDAAQRDISRYAGLSERRDSLAFRGQSHSRPGFRFEGDSKMGDQPVRDDIEDLYARHADELENAWRNDQPDRHAISTTADGDSRERAYREYETSLVDAWRVQK